jgi:prepilin-type N-terminal cleavage/methylation domain-containing protein
MKSISMENDVTMLWPRPTSVSKQWVVRATRPPRAATRRRERVRPSQRKGRQDELRSPSQFRPAKSLFTAVGMARCAVRAAFSGATVSPTVTGWSRVVPPATTRAGTSQRDVPTTLYAASRQRAGSACHQKSLDAFTLLELLVVIAIIGVLAGLLMPALNGVKAKARNIACVSQLRQLGIATRVYADEHNNLLPTAEILPSLPVDPDRPRPRICDVLGPYLGRANTGTNTSTAASVFRCPADKADRFAAEGSSYGWNTQLNGHRMDETKSSNVKFSANWVGSGGSVQTNGTVEVLFSPTTTPLLLDYEEFHQRRPPKTGKNVVFMDNHVEPLEILPER